MLHFVTSYMKQNKSRKQTLESAQYGLEISFKRARLCPRRGRQLEENISSARTLLSPRLLYHSTLMDERYLATRMWLCEGN